MRVISSHAITTRVTPPSIVYTCQGSCRYLLSPPQQPMSPHPSSDDSELPPPSAQQTCHVPAARCRISTPASALPRRDGGTVSHKPTSVATRAARPRPPAAHHSSSSSSAQPPTTLPSRVAASLTPTFFDPWNSSSTGHQRAENRLSGSTSWRQSRNLKLEQQYRGGLDGGNRVADTVGAGSEDFGKDGRKPNGGWEKGANGLRTGGQKSLVELWGKSKASVTLKPSSQEETRASSPQHDALQLGLLSDAVAVDRGECTVSSWHANCFTYLVPSNTNIQPQSTISNHKIVLSYLETKSFMASASTSMARPCPSCRTISSNTSLHNTARVSPSLSVDALSPTLSWVRHAAVVSQVASFKRRSQKPEATQ